jgi:hypothetical protein
VDLRQRSGASWSLLDLISDTQSRNRLTSVEPAIGDPNLERERALIDFRGRYSTAGRRMLTTIYYSPLRVEHSEKRQRRD